MSLKTYVILDIVGVGVGVVQKTAFPSQHQRFWDSPGARVCGPVCGAQSSKGSCLVDMKASVQPEWEWGCGNGHCCQAAHSALPQGWSRKVGGGAGGRHLAEVPWLLASFPFPQPCTRCLRYKTEDELLPALQALACICRDSH